MVVSLERVKKIVDRVLDTFAVILFLVIFIVVLLQVFMRYVLGSPLVWSEELARYLFVWVSFLGWVFATRSGTHIRIGAFTDSLPVAFRKVIGIFNFLLIVVFALVLAYYGQVMVRKNLDVPTVTLFFSYAVVYMAVPFSTLLIVFYAVVRLVSGDEDKGGTVS
jgi:TRAP-type C4-dicarboxylate transport system permease small subunit